MRRTLIASMALLLVAASPVSAGMLLQPKDNDHKGVVNSWAFQSGAAGQYSARIYASADSRVNTATTNVRAGTRAFILSATDNDHKKVENEYAQ